MKSRSTFFARRAGISGINSRMRTSNTIRPMSTGNSNNTTVNKSTCIRFPDTYTKGASRKDEFAQWCWEKAAGSAPNENRGMSGFYDKEHHGGTFEDHTDAKEIAQPKMD